MAEDEMRLKDFIASPLSSPRSGESEHEGLSPAERDEMSWRDRPDMPSPNAAVSDLEEAVGDDEDDGRTVGCMARCASPRTSAWQRCCMIQKHMMRPSETAIFHKPVGE